MLRGVPSGSLPPAGATRAEKKAQTRRRLLQAAAAVFARRGFHGASVEEIAAEAGMTTGALYWHFAGKEALFLALADEQVERRVAEIASLAEDADDPAALQDRVAQQFASFIEHDPDWPLLFFEFWAYGARDPRLREEFAERRRAVQQALAQTVERATRAYGLTLTIPSEQLAIGLGALINGLAFERVADPDAVPDALVGQLVWSLVLGAVVGFSNPGAT
jgi:AcrR family transcriptional regulator